MSIDISKLSEELAILKREKEKIEEHLLIVGRGSGKFTSQLILYAILQPEPLKSELLIMIEELSDRIADGVYTISDKELDEEKIK